MKGLSIQIGILVAVIVLCMYFLYVKEGFVDAAYTTNTDTSTSMGGLSYEAIIGICIGGLLLGGAFVHIFLKCKRNAQMLNTRMYPRMYPRIL